MEFNDTKDLALRWGPQWEAIRYVRDVMIPALDKRRAEAIFEMAHRAPYSELPQRNAFEAARLAGGDRERQLVQASEDLRKAIWEVIWDSTWVDAWHLSWVVSRVGIGLSVLDLMHDGKMDRGEYIHLVAPWLMGGFSDLNLWAELAKGREESDVA